jgi:hypothetical protein
MGPFAAAFWESGRECQSAKGTCPRIITPPLGDRDLPFPVKLHKFLIAQLVAPTRGWETFSEPPINYRALIFFFQYEV